MNKRNPVIVEGAMSRESENLAQSLMVSKAVCVCVCVCVCVSEKDKVLWSCDVWCTVHLEVSLTLTV